MHVWEDIIPEVDMVHLGYTGSAKGYVQRSEASVHLPNNCAVIWQPLAFSHLVCVFKIKYAKSCYSFVCFFSFEYYRILTDDHISI